MPDSESEKGVAQQTTQTNKKGQALANMGSLVVQTLTTK